MDWRAHLDAARILTKRGGKRCERTISYIPDKHGYRCSSEYCFRWAGEKHFLESGKHEAALPRTK